MFLFTQHQFCSFSFGGCSISGAMMTCRLNSMLSRQAECAQGCRAHKTCWDWQTVPHWRTNSTGRRRGMEEDAVQGHTPPCPLSNFLWASDGPSHCMARGQQLAAALPHTEYNDVRRAKQRLVLLTWPRFKMGGVGGGVMSFLGHRFSCTWCCTNLLRHP